MKKANFIMLIVFTVVLGSAFAPATQAAITIPFTGHDNDRAVAIGKAIYISSGAEECSVYQHTIDACQRVLDHVASQYPLPEPYDVFNY
jgi:hypothetical protein